MYISRLPTLLNQDHEKLRETEKCFPVSHGRGSDRKRGGRGETHMTPSPVGASAGISTSKAEVTDGQPPMYDLIT